MAGKGTNSLRAGRMELCGRYAFRLAPFDKRHAEIVAGDRIFAIPNTEPGLARSVGIEGAQLNAPA